ncbi:MAG: 30S ribosome-binding factor RbfA [Candidatus Eisenbacteria bacterium]|nr:30S ribosome-binding factor RbfA [Candidatus Latescibacterota bacterium]MBD3303459.1 30S ribosome-binding factor RbfA [Candidatus Eisenbacteria bacterium]
MSNVRAARLAEQLREQISDILLHHLADPRLGWTSVLRVELSRDLRHARVHISVLGDEETQEAGFRVVHRAAGAVRAELGRRLRIKRIPELRFVADRSIEYSLKIERMLEDLGFSGPPSPDVDREDEDDG